MLDGIFVIYKLGCFVGTFYITFVLFDQYYANDDASKVLIKRFAEAGRNSFPTITLCFHDDGSNGLFNNDYISSINGLSKGAYRDALMGKVSEVNNSILQDPKIFQSSTIKLERYLLKFKIDDVDDQRVFDWRQYELRSRFSDDSEKLPIDLYYQEPNLLCYSYHANFDGNTTVDSINYFFNISKLQTIKGGEIYIYVHYVNQLIRNMRYVYKIRSFQGISHANSNNQLVLDLRYISIMRSRKDAREPCNESLKNDDKEWMKNVLSVIKCFPSYWENIFLNTNSLNRCKTQKELEKATKYHPRNNERITKSILRMYTQPCDQMRVSINSNDDQYDDPDVFKLKFRFR